MSTADTAELVVKLMAQVAELTAQKNAAYAERNRCVAALAHVVDGACSRQQGVAFIAIDHAGEDGWGTVLVLQTSGGQFTWHFHDSERHLLTGLEEHPFKYDGHTTEEKYRRLAAWVVRL